MAVGIGNGSTLDTIGGIDLGYGYTYQSFCVRSGGHGSLDDDGTCLSHDHGTERNKEQQSYTKSGFHNGTVYSNLNTLSI
ncbi:MAG: hypothetical protein BWY72_00063 [Bacteroidetes bacterium ADurb.Bin416]|nr:MAG: hypothetical protein BWY72_00063 [Bacteroidetes bacterium ADurb.Bin416]